MRRRDAAARCPELNVLDRHLEQRDPDLRGGAVRGRGDRGRGDPDPARAVCPRRWPAGSTAASAQAAAVVAEHLVGAGLWDCRIGIADGIFAAEQAARQAAPQDCRIVPEGRRRGSWRRLPVAVLDDPDLVALLRRLGIRSLGDFADPGAAGRADPLRRRTAPGCTGWPGARTPGPRSPGGRRWSSTSGSSSSRRWRPSSRSCSAPGRPPSAASPSWPGTGWSAPRCGSRWSATAAGPGRGPGRTRAGSPRPT